MSHTMFGATVRRLSDHCRIISPPVEIARGAATEHGQDFPLRW